MSTWADKTRLSDFEWENIFAVLITLPGIRVGNKETSRAFVDAMLWVLRAGGQWRALPSERGNWNSVFKRYARWNQKEVWPKILEAMSKVADLQDVSLDSTVIRAHACAAGAAYSTAEKEALGRSKGGFSCKIHMAVDAHGMPLKVILTGGQVADVTQAIPLIEDITADAFLADKAYDADAVIEVINEKDAKAVIPPKSNRKEPRECDFYHYKERHVVECTFGKLKYYRGLATRYAKKAINYMGLLAFACSLVWLR